MRPSLRRSDPFIDEPPFALNHKIHISLSLSHFNFSLSPAPTQSYCHSLSLISLTNTHLLTVTQILSLSFYSNPIFSTPTHTWEVQSLYYTLLHSLTLPTALLCTFYLSHSHKHTLTATQTKTLSPSFTQNPMFSTHILCHILLHSLTLPTTLLYTFYVHL